MSYELEGGTSPTLFNLQAWNGKQAHPDSMNTWLKKFVKNNNLPPITPKSFRHMAATYLITSGTDIRTVAGKLGHANTNTTTVVYSHLLKSAEKETADKMESFLKQASDKAKNQQKSRPNSLLIFYIFVFLLYSFLKINGK
ncbi:tyrosine-type recombinase/integrase [Sporomusa aerivorans]|uniref:tyrosine-type recombinase/integrase n=1 Tax=Sporomusa aerivorans TaxID=204936 RepID=UPI00352A94F3